MICAGLVNDSTRLTLTGGWMKEEKYEKELRALLLAKVFAAFQRRIHRKDGQQGDEQKQGEERFHAHMIQPVF
jgi:hypothetical protein